MQPGAPLLTLTRLDGLVVTVGIEPADRDQGSVLGQAVTLASRFRRRRHSCRARCCASTAYQSENRQIDADIAVSRRLRHLRRRVQGRTSPWASSRLDRAARRCADATARAPTCSRSRRQSQARGRHRGRSRRATTMSVNGSVDPQPRTIVVQGNYQLSDGMAVRSESGQEAQPLSLRRIRRAARAHRSLCVAVAVAAAGAVPRCRCRSGCSRKSRSRASWWTSNAGSRPADQTALLVTRPVEEAIRTVPGVQDVRSETTRGSAQISIDFGWGRDMIASTLLVDSAVSPGAARPAGGHQLRRAADGPDGVSDHLLCAAVGHAVAGRAARSGAISDRAAAFRDRRPRRGSTCRAARPPRSRCWRTRTGLPLMGWTWRSCAALAGQRAAGGRATAGQATSFSWSCADRSIGKTMRSASRRARRPRRCGPRARRRHGAGTASCRNGSAWWRTASRPCCSTSTSSRTATPCRSPGRCAASSPHSGCRRRCASGELVRSERAGHPVGRQRARCGTDRPRPCRLVLLLFLRSWRVTLIAVSGRPGDARRHRARAEPARHELQHHDARRHRGRGRIAHRRCHRHGRAHRPPGRRAIERGRRGSSAVLPAGARVSCGR